MFPPTPPDPKIRDRNYCSICRNKVRRSVIDAAMDKGVSNAAIQRDMAETGWKIGLLPLSRHRRHYVSALTVSSTKRRGNDLAVIVRDRTIQAIEDGRLSIEDESWKNVGPGLKAQDVLDRRENKTNDRKTMLAIAAMLTGTQAVPAALLIEDGDVIEGEAVEVDEDD